MTTESPIEIQTNPAESLWTNFQWWSATRKAKAKAKAKAAKELRAEFNAAMAEGAELVRKEREEEKRLVAEARAEFGGILHTPFTTRVKQWWASLWAKSEPIPTNEFSGKADPSGIAGWLKKL